MTDHDPPAATTATGQLHGLRLGFDKTGRPFIEGKCILQHIDDDYALLLKQSQALEVAFTFETKTELLELFPDYVQWPGGVQVERHQLERHLEDEMAAAGHDVKITVGSGAGE